MQQIEIIGTVTKVQKPVDTGRGRVLNFDIAVEQKSGPAFYQIALWNDTIQTYQKYAKKDNVLKISGELNIGSYASVEKGKVTVLQINNPTTIMPVRFESSELAEGQELETWDESFGAPDAVEVIYYQE